MRKNIPIIILSVLIIAIIGFFAANNFNTDLVLCNKVNGDCRVIAKFKDFNTCQVANERWGWYCNQVSDPNKIICRKGEGMLGFSHCKK